MAGDWIAVTTDLHSRLEVLQIAHKTNRNRFEVCGLLAAFWGWAQNETSDGLVPGVPVASLEGLIGADCEFWQAVVEFGWIIEDGDGLRIPNFERWMSESAKKRLRENRRKAAARKSEESRTNVPPDSGQMSAPEADKSRTNRGTKSGTRAKNSRAKNSNTKKAIAKARGAGALAVLKKLRQQNFTVSDLGDASKIIQAHGIVTGGPENLVKASGESLRWVFCVAVHCVDASRREKNPVESPVGLFFSMLVDESADGITNEQQDRAMEILKKHQRAGPPPGNSEIEQVRQQLADGKKVPTNDQNR